MADPTPYPELNAVLDEFVRGLRVNLGRDLVAACLQGSFAVGDFDEHSDVDFIVVSEDEPSDRQVKALQIMHGDLYDVDCPWAQHLEGSYFPKRILRDYLRAGTPLWYLDHGSRSLVRSNHCNTVVVRWVVREHGVGLVGQDPSSLVNPIPVKALRKEILSTIRDWGQEILDQPERFNNRFYQTFIVLNYCRMLRDLCTGETGSKRAGADWAKANLDPVWTELIDRTWDGRPNPALSVGQPADVEDFRLTLEFVQYIIKEAGKYAVPMEE
jgi:hypothetical protein